MPTSSKSRDVLPLVIILSALFLGVLTLFTEILLYSQNTLYSNQNWVITKRKSPIYMMGADDYLLNRAPLSNNQLDLSDWGGYQEVLYKEALLPKEILFEFKLKDAAYLYVIFGKTEKGYSGIRLSQNPAFENVFFEARPDGKFTLLKPLGAFDFASRWHHARIDLLDHVLNLSIDGKYVTAITGVSPTKGEVGFRGGHAPAVINNVLIREVNGKTFSDSFSNHKLLFANGALVFAALVLLLGVLFLISRKSNRQGALFLFRAILLLSLLLATGTSYYLFDRFFWSKRAVSSVTHPFNSFGKVGNSVILESGRYQFFEFFHGIIGGEKINKEGILKRGYPDYAALSGDLCGDTVTKCEGKKTEKRILYVGTSQTYGIGVSKDEDTFFHLTHHKIQNALSGKYAVHSVNISLPGAISTNLIPVLQQQKSFQPDLIVINLSSNDSLESLKESLEPLVLLAKEYAKHVILLKEANSFEFTNAIENKHLYEEDIAKKMNVPILDLHGYLNQSSLIQSGILWWDYVHLTAYGQTLVADWLAPQLLKEL